MLDTYAIKLLTSGYKLDQVKKITLGGVRGYENNLKRCREENKPVYRTAEESGGSRWRTKLIGKSTWFKKGSNKKGNTDGEDLPREGKTNEMKVQKDSNGSKLKTRSVLFVENTPGGELAGRIRELLRRLEPTIGFRIKVVEKAGTN